MKAGLFSGRLALQSTILNCVFAIMAHAAPGDLDASFAGAGTMRFGFGGGYDYGNAVAVQADSKLIIAGFTSANQSPLRAEFAVVRFDTNHVLDASFGDGGKVVTPVNSGDYEFPSAEGKAVGVQTDGRIVVAGYAYNGTNYSTFTVVRYQPDGSLDTSFGGSGKVYTDFDQRSQINALAIQIDGKIVVAGWVGGISSPGRFALARYETNGVLDATFGSGGKVITDANGGASAEGLLLQADGKIVAVGRGGSDFAVIRYLSNGALDNTFGGGTGKVFTRPVTYNVGEHSAGATAVAYQFGNFTPQNPDKLVVAGFARDSTAHSLFTVIRYNLDGTLDSSFGNGGFVTNAISAPSVFGDHPRAVAVQGFGIQPRKITVSGRGSSGTNTYFVVARYNANGSLDTTLNGTGTAIISFGAYHDDEPHGMAFQGGKAVIAGASRINDENTDFTAVRLNSDGSLDTTFDSDGVVTADIADRESQGYGLSLQSDGKVIVAGSAENGANRYIAIARLNPDGSFDPSFGAFGKITTPVGVGSAEARAVSIQPDGKIVVTGNGYNGANNDFAVVRYHSDGSLDASFNGTGKVLTPIGAGADGAVALTFQPDGKIVVAGNSHNGSDSDFGIARYLTNGAPDASFGVGGKVSTAIGSGDDAATAVRIQADGKIVTAGYSVSGMTAYFALARHNTNGTVDTSFGTIGRVTTDFGIGLAQGLAMVIQPDGRIIVAGAVIVGANAYVALARYNTNGTRDTSFGVDGKVITQVGFVADIATSIVLQPDGKLLVGGISKVGDYFKFLVVRYNMDGSLDTVYGSDGSAVVDFGIGSDQYGYGLALDSNGRAVMAGDAGRLFGVARLQGDPELRILSLTRLGNGHVVLEGAGIPNGSHTLHGSLTPNNGGFTPLGAVNADPAGLWMFEDMSAVGLSNRFYRLSYP